MSVKIISSNDLLPIEQHFKISAGPGAGKTYWLVNHIRSIVQHSSRLGSSKKVACITYTNIGVETIIKRLNVAADRVEVSTIHSFLYKHIIKPYILFISAEFGIDAKRIEGHDDHFPSRSKITEWVQCHVNVDALRNPYSVKQLTQLPQNLEGLGNWLSSLKYAFENGELRLKADNSEAYYYSGTMRRNLGKANCLDILSGGLLDYKKLFWSKGILHHDDVLFLSYVLTVRYPFITKIIQAKFPYILLDEFQDTNPVQAELIKLWGQGTSFIGVIGDQAQSIFSFQGASPADFERFSLPAVAHYVMNENRRSTNSIIDVLNSMRRDVSQRPVRNVAGTKPHIVVGSSQRAYDYSKDVIASENVATLCWDNISSNAFKKQIDSGIPSHDLIQELLSKDQNRDRRTIILSILQALELAKNKHFKAAIKEVEKNFRAILDKETRKKVAFKHLLCLLAEYEGFVNEPLSIFLLLLKTMIRPNLSNLSKGGAKDFYESYTYNQIAVCINSQDDNSLNRTIHKSKGDEFDNVFVQVKDESDLTFLLAPNLFIEKHRVFYVALSRGREHLFISVPTLSSEKQSKLKDLFEVVRI